MQETQEMWVQSLGWEDSLNEEMTIHFSILAWRFSWTEESGRLQSIGLQRVRHDLAHITCKASRLFIAVYYDPLYFCGVLCNFFFISNIIHLNPPLFFLVCLPKGLSILFIFKKKKKKKKKQLLVSFIFVIVLLIFMSFVSAMIFMIFILVSLGFGSSSFSSCFSCTVSLLIWDLPCFLRKNCIVINAPFRTVFATYWGFPCGESICSAGYLGSIPV